MVHLERYRGVPAEPARRALVEQAQREDAIQRQQTQADAMDGAHALPGSILPAHMPCRDGVRRARRPNCGRRTKRTNHMYSSGLMVKEYFKARYFFVLQK